MLAAVILLLLIGTYATGEYTSTLPCEHPNIEKLICRRTSFSNGNIPSTNKSFVYQITHLEWIESGIYLLSNNLFDTFPNLQNVSLRSNSLTSLSTLPFWFRLYSIHHLDLSQNRLITISTQDFQHFQSLSSLNISGNLLTTIEPIWLLISLHTIDLSQNGINAIGYRKIHNSTIDSSYPCSLNQIYLNNNRGLLSFAQLKTTLIDTCPFIERFELTNNHWHCTCSDLINSLKHYRTLFFLDEQQPTLSGQCETPLNFRNIDIRKMSEELVCDRLLLLDSMFNEEQQQSTTISSSSSSFLSRQILFLFLIGILVGIVIGICLHYCARRCRDTLGFMLFKFDRRKVEIETNPDEQQLSSLQMTHRNSTLRHFIYCPTVTPDPLPSYAEVMNDIFYLDAIHPQPHSEIDVEC